MAEKTERVVPIKCRSCDRPMSTPLFCDYCRRLCPVPSVSDHFQLLGLPRRFAIDEQALHDAYVALSRHAHPDYHVGDSPEVQALSMTVSSAVNEAYRTLSDALSRAGYLLELSGGPSASEDKAVPAGFLETMMMMQEELADARAAGDADELARLAEVLQTQRDGLARRVTALYAQLDEAVGCEAVRQDLFREIRRQLNAASYVDKLLKQAQGDRGEA